jgi:hypothetical protein
MSSSSIVVVVVTVVVVVVVILLLVVVVVVVGSISFVAWVDWRPNTGGGPRLLWQSPVVGVPCGFLLVVT